MAGFQVTVTNSGSPQTIGGILFDTGDTVVGAATLELMVDLGLLDAFRAPNFTYGAGEDDATASGSVVFTLTAAAHVV